MAKFFNKVPAQAFSPRQNLLSQYQAGRGNLLLVVIFTLINVILICFGQDMYFLFSATLPYVIAVFGAIFCGMMPDEYYDDPEAYRQIFDSSKIYIFAAVAVAIIALYFICFLFSGKRAGFLIAAMVMFSLDTLFMLFFYGFSMLVDILFHAWVLFYLIKGVYAHYKLKQMPEDFPSAPPVMDENGEACEESTAYEQSAAAMDYECENNNTDSIGTEQKD
ncbi:MAG: hypothetical protein IJA86_08715 [Clostridia bacterium]|nr:hypothetical protein [Clostridia bacterium]